MKFKWVRTDMQHNLETNQEVFRRLKPAIDRGYPRGHWVAITDGQIIADALSIDQLSDDLRASGKDAVDVLVAQAGVEYPEEVVILVSDVRS